jgi:AcrR family transcriptional regulator
MSAELGQRPNELRERILDATLHVICERGMARTRTSAIARTAGCSEGSIYRYFEGKPELFREVVRTRLPTLALPGLAGRAGSATVEANLVDAARAALSFYTEVVPLYADLLSDRRDGLPRGELTPRGAIADYLRAEQRLGRVRRAADVELVAELLLSGCLGESFLLALAGERLAEPHDERAREIVRLAVRELEPEEGVAP